MSNAETTDTNDGVGGSGTETTETNDGVGGSASSNVKASGSGTQTTKTNDVVGGSVSSNAKASGSGTETTETNDGDGGSASSNAKASGSTSSDAKASGSSSSKVKGSGGEDDIFKLTLLVVDQLYNIRDNFFSPTPREKFSIIDELINNALQLLDSIPVENRNLPMQCATYEYLRGKIMDASPSYKTAAEDHLVKAVKLNPSLGDAWLSLGNCIWKKGERIAAKNCMKRALSKGPNKRILCQLSTFERKSAIEFSEGNVAEQLVKNSIKHAKEAVAMDVTDGYSWYCLGDAFLRAFFVTGTYKNLTEILQSLKAYQNADKDAKMKYNPTFTFNYASVNKYLENYERALSGYEASALTDLGLDAEKEIRKMVEFFDRVESLLKAHSKAKEIVKVKSVVVPYLDSIKLKPPFRRATLDILQEGVNKEFAIVGEVLRLIRNENETPLYFALCDSNFKCYILSVYDPHCETDSMKNRDQITILDPCYRHQDFSWKGKRYVFESLRVDDREQVRVNGKVLSLEQCAKR